MALKVTNLAVSLLLFFSTLIVIFFGNVTAMNDEHNLSGLIWMSDGSTPPSQTGFAVWVNHSGVLYRFPDTGWYLTSDVVNGTLWYSLVLPDEYHGVRWDHWDTYSVEVDASLWGDITGNTTSNATGSVGDPFPVPYDPTNPANSYNKINYTAGGGIKNEQQWDVRTMAPRDLIPTNITVDGLDPEDYPSGIPVGGGDTVTIYFNTTSVGLIGTQGLFNASAWNCSATGVNNPEPSLREFYSLGPLNEYGNVSGNGYDTGVLSFEWTAPIQPGDYYINITVDSGFNITEFNETNNTVILHFIVGPDIIPIDVTVDGIEYQDWPQISPIILPAPGQWIHIILNITNVGATSTGSVIPFNVSFYNVSVTGAHDQLDPSFYNSPAFFNLNPGQIFFGGEAYWYAPAPGEFRINLTVDYGETIGELNELNNTYVLRVLVGPDVIPTNVTVYGQLLATSPSSPIPIGLGQTVPIGVNSTNIGFSPTGRITWVGFYNSTVTNDMLSQPYYNISVPELNGSSDPGNTSFVTGGYWISPNIAGTYYVTIYVDIANDTYEFNETNNHFVICFVVGPDLTYTNVTVDDAVAAVLDPTEIWYVGSGETVMIGTNATNVGATPTGLGFWVSFTNCTSTGQNQDPPFTTFYWPNTLDVWENTTAFIASWVVPNFVGDLYVNISVDYLYDISESVENNNTYILHFVVGPDYIPSRITVDGQIAGDESMIWNVTPGVPVNIGVNCSNIGLSNVNSAIIYTISFYNSTAARTIGAEFDNVTLLPGLPAGGDSGEQIGSWTPPNQPGDYYVLIFVDSTNTTWEIDETNNTFLLHFALGPDLIPTNVSVDSMPTQIPSLIWYVGPGETVIIGANATNIGFSGTGVAFNMSLYNVSIAGSAIIGDSNPFNITISALDSGEDSGHFTWIWLVPVIAGDYYVNISVDIGNVSWESNEYNNNFTIHFVVACDLIPNNVTVDGIPITSYPLEVVTVYPNQVINISANVLNVGLSSTGALQFNMTFWNSSDTGQTMGAWLFDSGLLGPLGVGGFTSDNYTLWIAPSPDKPTFYYINITVDSTWSVSEWVETNNTYILKIKVDAPDLTPDKIELEVADELVYVVDEPYSLIPIPFVSEEIFIPVGSNVTINFTIANIGGIDQLIGTNVTAYNISGIGGAPIDDPFYESGPEVVNLSSGNSTLLSIIWLNLGVSGTYYINISIDYNGTLDIGGRVIELNETNNTFTLVINVTSKPITTLHAGTPKYQPGVYWYINSSTELNFTVIGPNPPLYTWYRIINLTNGSEAKGWSNYTEEAANFTMKWGEGTFRIEYNSTNAIGDIEPTRNRTIIVDDSPPVTNITIGNPQYNANPPDILNVTSQTPFDLSAFDLPWGMSIAGPPNASGIGQVPGSGRFYRIQNLSTGLNVTGWLKYSTGSPFYLDDPTWGDGDYRIWFNSTDNLLQAEDPNFIDVYLDNTGPVTSIAVGDPKYLHTDPTIEWYVTSSTPFILGAYEAIGSGANSSTIRFRITNLDTGNMSGWIVGTSFDISSDYPYWAIEGDGNYTIEFRSQDFLGNWGPTDSIEVYVDDTPPDATLNVGNPRYRVDQIHRWNITSETDLDLPSDDGEGCGTNYTEYRIYNGTYTSIWFTYALSSFDLSSLLLNDGVYTIEYRSYDYLDNNQTFSESIYLDNTPPETNMTDPSMPRYRDDISHIWNITSDSQLTLDSNDGLGCGVNYSEYRVLDGDTKVPLTIWLSAGTFMLIGFVDGYYIIEFRSVDFLGNIEPINNYTVYLDNTPPNTTIDVGEPKYRLIANDTWNVTKDTELYLSSTDGIGSGVWIVYYKMRHYQDTTNWNLILPITYNGSYFLITGPEGNYTLRYWAIDNVYNEEPYHEYFVVVDNTPPVTNITFGDPQYRANETADTLNITNRTPITLTSVDYGDIPVGVEFEEYLIDDDDNLSNGDITGWITYDAMFNLSGFADGDYVIYYHAVDHLGNTEIVKNTTIIVDSTPPKTEFRVEGTNHTKLEAGDYTWWIKPDTDLELIAIDLGVMPVGLNYTEYWIDSQWYRFFDGQEMFDLSQLSNGSHYIQFISVDYLNNSEELTIRTVIVDDAGPDMEIVSSPDVELPSVLPQVPLAPINFFETTNLTIDAKDIGVPLGEEPSGVSYIQYIIDPEDPSATWQDIPSGSYNIFTLMGEWYQNTSQGYWHHNISLRAFDNLSWEGPVVTIWFFIEGDIMPPLPPILKVFVRGDDIYLEWIPSPDEDIHHYLIYRSTTKTGFDFSDIWIDTSEDDDQGVFPLRTTWNDTTDMVRTSHELYYTIRGVDDRNNIGYTSNIAGKATLSFEKGYNTFSLPLEPFESISASEMLNNKVFKDKTDTIYRYNTSSQKWLGHPKFLPASINGFTLEFGEGYMLYISEDKMDYTFTGSTGTSIRYIGGVGDEAAFRDSLTIEVKEEGVHLSWTQATDATGYSIYRGSSRIEEDSLTDFNLEPVHETSGNDTTWTDDEADDDEYYFMIVAQDMSGEQSSTYAMGVKRYTFEGGYTLFSLELEPKTSRELSWYSINLLSEDSDTLFYYDRRMGTWRGHPKFLPESINNDEVSMGEAYIVYLHTKEVRYAFIGI